MKCVAGIYTLLDLCVVHLQDNSMQQLNIRYWSWNHTSGNDLHPASMHFLGKHRKDSKKSLHKSCNGSMPLGFSFECHYLQCLFKADPKQQPETLKFPLDSRVNVHVFELANRYPS